MKILCPVKRVPDPELKTKVKDNQIDLSQATWVVNTFDEYAVEAALRLIENGDTGDRDGEVVVITIGPEDAGQQLRSALAMGADRGIHIAGEDSQIDAGTVVDALAVVFEQEKPDLILMGKQAVDGDANVVGQMLAGKLGLPQATFAASIELATDKASLTVGRETDSGVEFKKVALPAVVTVDLRIISPRAVVNHVTPESHAYQDGPRYASLKGIMAAKKKPMDKKTLADFGITPAPVVVGRSVTLPAGRKAGQMVKTVEELVKKLHEEAKVI